MFVMCRPACEGILPLHACPMMDKRRSDNNRSTSRAKASGMQHEAFMISHFVRASILAAVCVAALATESPARTPYDGAWSVLIVTTNAAIATAPIATASRSTMATLFMTAASSACPAVSPGTAPCVSSYSPATPARTAPAASTARSGSGGWQRQFRPERLLRLLAGEPELADSPAGLSLTRV